MPGILKPCAIVCQYWQCWMRAVQRLQLIPAHWELPVQAVLLMLQMPYPTMLFYRGAGYNITLTSVILPSYCDFYWSSAFGYCHVLESVTIPSSVTSIGNSAFCYCPALSSINLPALLNSIGNFSFGQCTGLTSITIPSSVTSIDKLAFYSCSGLTSPAISISSSLTSIGERGICRM